MDIEHGDLLIYSGTGETGVWERYEGARTAKAIRARLSRERARGDRWAQAWIEMPGQADNGSRVFGKLGKGLDEIETMRGVPEAEIRINPAARLAASKRGRSPASRETGRLGGRPRMVEKNPEIALGLGKTGLDRLDWAGCYPYLGRGGICLAVLSAVDIDGEGRPVVLAGQAPREIHFDEARQAWVPGGGPKDEE